ncbi:MAG: hypothetical protein DRI89_01390 [Bacteroidetes bacterium]|nr:MAG: hypothetical protein DRI89_01390 [Bacteroidota bacterium]
MSQNIIQTVGTLIKKETLASVQDEMNCNILMLESQQPFPGYHGLTVPELQEPDSLFALTSGEFNSEFIIRTVHNINKEVAFNFSATPGTIQFKNGLSEVIRFKGLLYKNVGEVITKFSNTGIGFKKHRAISPYSSIIKVRKFFKVEKIDSRLFKDLIDEGTHYLQIPAFLDWDAFETMTNAIKYNLQNNNFDAALTSVYYEKGVMDLIRIYDAEADKEKLNFILDKYMEAINRL